MGVKIRPFCQSLRVTSSLPALIVFLITFYVHQLESARFTVIGSANPITAMVGEDVILPCYLSPKMSAENMEVTWLRPQFSSVVHLYREGKDQLGLQGRTELLKDNIQDGNVTLRILNIRPFDQGQYNCLVDDGTVSEQAVLELKVKALGSDPLISVEDYKDGGIQVVCRSAGWFPEPHMSWRNLAGQLLPSASEIKSQGDDGLYKTESYFVIRENSNQSLSCSIISAHQDPEKKSTIHISGPFFPKVSPWMTAFCVILVALFIFIGLAIYLFKVKGKLVEELRWARAMKHPENVMLDLDTANPWLVSEDQKSVRRDDKQQDLPDNPERFDTDPCVLGCEGFSSGRHYWEVEVGDGKDWAVGVARESVRRKGESTFNSDEGVWAVQRWGGQYQALTSPVTPLSMNWVLRRVGIYLDYDRGQVAFFDADNESLIFTFPLASFMRERIHPWLWVWNSPLRLCH
ncbi:butyrophilin subfamily 1 member A1 isoform X2 [Alligator mississippiensis]|uniref:Butyrophilin subfamily 1 member A1 n=1 Tax=Alligator mississippiensis TaxID=8496 RepID=A0A151MUR8_ALLMI|nr:butyrophilin subfamily 1 member A1 isoform X2 [Alligator mississippiensis]KYO28224.1 butyrophilin subfamily 1 member A1 precursor [Alligator mississippiensis]